MIQFNLLPDVKVEYIKAMRTKRMVIGTAVIVTATTCVIFLLLAAVVYGIQKKSMSNLNDDIKTYSDNLKQTPDLDKILTIQNQLSALTGLHDKKFVVSRLFTYIEQSTPSGVTISDYVADFDANTITVTGAASSLDKVNTFTDTLKFSKYSKDGEAAADKAFTNVVLAQFGKNNDATSYSISMSFDPVLFSNTSEVGLIIPRGATTNSITGQPTEIFKKAPTPTNGQGI
jgi:Tfp pilus assembly protein PilN